MGGVEILDLSDPSAPQEVVHYVGTQKDQTYYWGAKYYRGRIWANDRVRGLDVLAISDPRLGAKRD